MTDALYNVVIRLTQEGSTGPFSGDTLSKAKELDGHIDRIRGNTTHFGEAMTSAFNGGLERVNAISDRVIDVGASMAKWGAAGALGAVTLGVAKLNNEFEQTQISLASIFNANGVSSNMAAGMTVAAGMMKDIRKDAAALPGETSDLLAIFRSNTIGGLRAGQSVQGIEKFSANVMAAGASSGLDMATVARESGALLAGRAGSHNILGSTLFGLTGDAAQKFNQESAAQRFETLSEGMQKYGAAIETYSHSYAGLSSSLYDNSKNYLKLATEPVFDKIKDSMERVSGWMTAHDGEIQSMMLTIGNKIADAFLRGEALIVKWGPAVIRFAEVAEDRLVGIFHKVEPIVEHIGSMFGKALSDPEGSLDKMGHIFELGAAMKFAGPMVGMSTSALGAAGVGGVAAGGGAVIGAAIAADFFLLANAISKSDAAANNWNATLVHTHQSLDHLSNIGDKIGPGLNTMVESQGAILAWNLELVSHAMDTTLGAVDKITNELSNRIPNALEIGFGRLYDVSTKDLSVHHRMVNDEVASFRHVKSDVGSREGKDQKITGGGGTTFNGARFEIVVNQNGDANRVARAVLDKIADMQRHPTSSRSTRNYSSSR